MELSGANDGCYCEVCEDKRRKHLSRLAAKAAGRGETAKRLDEVVESLTYRKVELDIAQAVARHILRSGARNAGDAALRMLEIVEEPKANEEEG